MNTHFHSSAYHMNIGILVIKNRRYVSNPFYVVKLPRRLRNNVVALPQVLDSSLCVIIFFSVSTPVYNMIILAFSLTFRVHMSRLVHYTNSGFRITVFVIIILMITLLTDDSKNEEGILFS